MGNAHREGKGRGGKEGKKRKGTGPVANIRKRDPPILLRGRNRQNNMDFPALPHSLGTQLVRIPNGTHNAAFVRAKYS